MYPLKERLYSTVSQPGLFRFLFPHEIILQASEIKISVEADMILGE